MARRPGALAAATAAAWLLAAAPGPGQRADGPLGERVYREHCAVCHGERGDGRGHAAHHFKTAPRDLTKGRFKIRSTTGGQPPSDDDLRRSIVRGLPGTGMLPQDHLSEAELRAVIAYIKTFSLKFAETPAPRALPLPPTRPPGADTLERGRAVYVKGECAECHGKTARGDGPSAKDLAIKPTDLTRRPFKVGPGVGDVVRTLLTGLDGTPMPSYQGVLEDDELWDLAYWIDSLKTPPVVTDDEREARHVVRMHQPRR
ncbi:MAG: c-type cytochrome [Candidatus Rokuibacteriota bacterium]